MLVREKVVSKQTLKENDKVLFVCIGNASRSQMAEAFSRNHGLRASSAGTRPAPAVNPVAIQVMNERMINMSQQRPKMVTTEMIQDADLVVTMGCSLEEVCPLPLLTQMKKKMIDWQLENPKDKPIEMVREIRDDIDNRVRDLFTKV